MDTAVNESISLSCDARPLRVLAIVPSVYDTSPGQRYRLEQWEPILREEGIEIHYEPFEDNQLHAAIYRKGMFLQKASTILRCFRRRLSLLDSVSGFDLIYVYREAALVGPAYIERKLAKPGVPIVFDFDDSIFLPSVSPMNGFFGKLKFSRIKTRTLCMLASHVMVGNAFLAEYARQLNSHVSVVPTTIDTTRYVPVERPSSGKLTIGWTGSHSTVAYLNLVRNALLRLSQKIAFRLRVIGVPDFRMEGIDCEVMPWRSNTEVQDLYPIDVGIMPLPDDDWTRGKCGCKALQYMGLGIPAVCSAVGANLGIVQDGQNGFLARDEDEWVEKLFRLLQCAELRSRVGQAGRRTVESYYSASVQVPRVAEIFRSVLLNNGASKQSHSKDQ